MRLTVRTLLAWLDHVLPPDEHRELDAKVAGSAAAHQLVDRIRRVVKQPTIPPPRVDGRGLAADPNSVAEYLDNCLEHDRLEAFERICIESDAHLAEVAACHEILATLARDPAATAPLDAAGRRRLLEAMRHHSAAVPANGEHVGPAVAARATRVAHDGEAAEPRAITAPRRRSSRLAWAAAAAALALLVTLAFVLTEAIGRSRGPRRDAEVPPAVAVSEPPAGAAPAPEPPAAAVEAGQADKTVASGLPVAVVPEPTAREDAEPDAAAPKPAPAAVAATDPAGVDVSPAPPAEPRAPPLPTAADEPAAPATGGVQPRVPQGDALAIAAAPVTVPGDAPPSVPSAPPEKPSAPPAGEAGLGFVTGEGIVIRRIADQGRAAWAALVPGAVLGPREELIAPFGFQPDLNVRGVTIRLLPGTRATITADADGTPRLEVVFGRAVVRSARPDARVGITAGGLTGMITAGLAGPAAISVELDRPPGADPTTAAARVRASVFAVNGGIVWRQGGVAADGSLRPLEGIAAEGMLDARTSISWESVAPDSGRVVKLEALPAWVEAAPQIDRLQRNAAEALEARILETGAVEQSLRELADDRRVENRVLAASTLSLLGDFDAAVELLCAESAGRRLEQRQWATLEAATVPLALARGANAAAKLRMAFEKRGPHGKAEELFAMARGFSDEELAAGAAAALVAALDDPDLVVRRYAIKSLCDIVQPSAADRLRYRADGLPDLRREGAAWWRGQLQKGLIRRPGAA
ncbi:MAG: hypothetical protein ACKOBP_07290 [Planctomycetia bacterium]